MKVLVLGAGGNFGKAAAEAFAASGHEVTRFRRGGDMVAAARGQDVIVNGLNPPKYHDWAHLIPAITAEVSAAARASGAMLIVPGNVYTYGVQPGVWGPGTAQVPCSRKGAIRVQMERDYRALSEQGVKVAILRAGDFVGDGPGTIWRMVMLKTPGTVAVLGRGKRAYGYLPDLGRLAVRLAEARESLPAFTDLPFAGFTLSAEDIAQRIEALTGQQQRLGGFPWWLMTLASPFWELARELREMRYLYDHSHSLDPAPVQALFPDFRATPLDVVLREHLPGHSAMVTQTGR
ncbi:epimerase [Stagnihabitans tardus]|nr:epimerase [Stagnihabitans tardus]